MIKKIYPQSPKKPKSKARGLDKYWILVVWEPLELTNCDYLHTTFFLHLLFSFLLLGYCNIALIFCKLYRYFNAFNER